MNQRIKHLLFLSVALLAAGCSDNTPHIPTPPPNTTGVYVCNEGNFNYSNASLSFYDPKADVATQEIALTYQRQVFPLGDICQSMAILGDRGYVVVNNSSKIYIFDLETNEYVGGITDLPSPRYVAFAGNTKGYVSDMISPSITIFDPQTCQKTGTVKVGRSTEQLLRYETSLFACNWSYGNQIYRIDTQTDKAVDSLTVTLQPGSMALDKNGKLWVLSDGAYFGSPVGQEMPALTRIDAKTFRIEQVFPLGDMDCSPSRLTTDGAGEKLFFLVNYTSTGKDGVYAMDVTASSLPTEPFISKPGVWFYGLGVDPDGGDIYVSDAIDFMQRGMVYRYSPSGLTPLGEFTAGIGPSSFCFRF